MRPGKSLIGNYLWIAAAFLAGAGPLAAQARIAIPAGTLTGQVQDSSTRQGLGYALVSVLGADRRAFANETGGFVITGLRPGADRIRIQQIGYAPVEVPVVLVDPTTDSSGSARLVVVVGRRITVLPEVVVEADPSALKRYRQPKGCRPPARAVRGAAGQLVLDQAVTNADRILALEREHPFSSRFEHVREASDSAGTVAARAIDTTVMTPRGRAGYRRGRVLVGARPDRTDAQYFSVVDLASDEFQKAHCAWYVGTDSTEGRRVHRVDFEPAPGVKSTDWAGFLSFDVESFLLVRSDAWLVRIEAKKTRLSAARCAVNYTDVAPTLVHENLAYCMVEQRGHPYPSVVETYRLLETRFLRGRPGERR